MVFIHGGSYGWGATSDPIYDGHNLVEKYPDFVLVTAAYRTGMMGFIDLSEVPGGEKFATSGNLGLLDQICAQKIRRAICRDYRQSQTDRCRQQKARPDVNKRSQRSEPHS